MPADYMHFNTHIAKIAAIGDESCVCYNPPTYRMKWDIIQWHQALNDSCYFHSRGKGKEPGPNLIDFQKLNDPKKQKMKNDIRKATKKQDKKIDIVRNQGQTSKQNLYKVFLKNRQKLFENYTITAQKLFRNYLRDAHNKIKTK